MSTIEQILDAIAPQLKDDPGKAIYIELAEGQVSSCNFGGQANYATALWAAHIGTLSNRSATSDGGAGAVTGKKEGDLSINYGSISGISGSLSALATTPYGLQLITLMKSKNLAIGATGGCDNGCTASWPEMVK